MTLLAAIDMGTGGMRTFYVRMQANGLPVVEGRKGYVYSLGKEIRQGAFSPQRIEEALAAFSQAMADIRTSGALLVGAVATEAFRAVDNGHTLLAAIAEQTGVRVRLISGEDELRL